MSIANSLEQSSRKIKELLRRENGDLEIFLPHILADIDAEIERIAGLERLAPIDWEAAAQSAKGEQHAYN